MISFEEAGEMLDEIVQNLPELTDLPGGINLSPEYKLHPEDRHNNLYVLGEYRNDHRLGNHIMIYYGSFIKINVLPEEFKEKLKKTLYHEITHHLEALAGEYDLEIEDEINIQRYKKRDSGQ